MALGEEKVEIVIYSALITFQKASII